MIYKGYYPEDTFKDIRDDRIVGQPVMAGVDGDPGVPQVRIGECTAIERVDGMAVLTYELDGSTIASNTAYNAGWVKVLPPEQIQIEVVKDGR